MSRPPSTAEVLAQFARELDAQTMQAPDDDAVIRDFDGNTVREKGTVTVPVFSEATRDAIVIEACRVMVGDGLDLVEIPGVE